ncbi:MAG TPA: RidA family protein [Vicinamibacterales bacterium]|nr:RidA family protein [Vicinamibacterales bacterium]
MFQKTLTNPSSLHKPFGYSHVATAEDARLIFLAGQVALDRDGTLVGRDDYPAQVRQVFANLGDALAAAGATFRDVIKMNYYCADVVPADIQLDAVRAVRDSLFDGAAPPASTFVVIRRLARPEFLIEIEAVAAIRVP